MDDILLEERVDRLESLFGRFLVNIDVTMKKLSREMQEFKDEGERNRKTSEKEMKGFKDENNRKFTQWEVDAKKRKIENEKKFAQWEVDAKKHKIENEKKFAQWEVDAKKHKIENEKKFAQWEVDAKKHKIENEKKFAQWEVDAKKRAAERIIETKKREEERKEETKKWNKQWGNLANKMGSILEDIISPAVRPVIESKFDDKIIDFYINRNTKSKKLNLQGEFDVVAVSEKNVYLIEVKSSRRIQYLDMFADNIEKFKKLLPEYSDKKLIPVFAGLRFEQEYIKEATKRGFYVMAYREWEYMDILNLDEMNKTR